MRSTSSKSGFVLVEALAALVITAIAAAGLLAALASARDRVEEAAVRSLALRQARHLLAEGASGDPTVLSGAGEMAAAGLTWTRSVRPLPQHQDVASIVVEVSWTTRRRTGTTRLETYRFIAP